MTQSIKNLNDSLTNCLNIPVKPNGNTVYEYDLRKLLLFGGASLSPRLIDFAAACKLKGSIVEKRISLVVGIYNSFELSLQEGARYRTLYTRLTVLRMYFNFCELNDLELEKTVESAQRAISVWINYHRQRERNGTVSETSSHTYIWAILAIYLDVLDCTIEELIGRMTLPRANKDVSKNEKTDLNSVDRFLDDLDDITGSLSLRAVQGNWPMEIKFRSGETVLYNGQGRPTNKIRTSESMSPRDKARRDERNRDVSFPSRRNVINLRTSTEILNFIGATGANLQVVLDLSFSDLRFESFGNQCKVYGFKNRRQENIEIRIPKTFRSTLQNWLKFRAAIFYGIEITRLFPIIDANLKETKNSSERGFRPLTTVLAAAGKPCISTKTLRFSRAQRLIRSVAIGGDVKKVASELQHGIPTLLKSYFTGSQQAATVEFARYFARHRDGIPYNSVRVGGSCYKPNAPVTNENHPELYPRPDCINPAGCFFCKQYRAIDNFDYIHTILSYREFLKMRLQLSGSTGSLDPLILCSIQKINDHIDQVKSNADKLSIETKAAEEEIRKGNFHAKWRGWIEILTFSEE